MQHILRYRRDPGRSSTWEPVEMPWQDGASAFLVAHDIYHHRPSDCGTFAQEVATFGAEWYVNLEALQGHATFLERRLERQGQAMGDIVAELVERKKATLLTFALSPLESPAIPLEERSPLPSLAVKAAQALEAAGLLSGSDVDLYRGQCLQHLRQGYWAARERYPEQLAVRERFDALVRILEELPESEVPEQHVITVERTGMAVDVRYDDADAAVVAMPGLMTALRMEWSWLDGPRGVAAVSFHPDERSFVEFVNEHFYGPQEQLIDGERVIPFTMSEGLRKVYLFDESMQARMMAGSGFLSKEDEVPVADQSPRGVWVYGMPD